MTTDTAVSEGKRDDPFDYIWTMSMGNIGAKESLPKGRGFGLRDKKTSKILFHT